MSRSDEHWIEVVLGGGIRREKLNKASVNLVSPSLVRCLGGCLVGQGGVCKCNEVSLYREGGFICEWKTADTQRPSEFACSVIEDREVVVYDRRKLM